ncbi:hypothetical protein M9Y10_027740 [Tritrichomonas musculus]|uniref:Protein kinase domain-containing protein n=1 Tax=Tritrichomonas musculus TaxID=1915356 RepID=A0ABR2H3X7_9EUKA
MKEKSIIMKKYEIISRIGEGGFGFIYKAREIGTQDIVTIKQIKKRVEPKIISQYTHTEISLLRELKGSANIIELTDYQANYSNNFAYIVYKYHEYDISDLIHQETPFSKQQIKCYFTQMISALISIHSKGYIHHDVKPRNFLVSVDNVIKLIDFGLSKKQEINIQNKNGNKSINIVGTLKYIAPEILLGETCYNNEIDVWSLGCTFYEILTSESLFSNCRSEEEIADHVIQIFDFPDENEWPEFYLLPNKDIFLKCTRKTTITADEFFESKIPLEYKPFKKLLLSMLQLNPKNRISLSDALNDPILSDSMLPEKLPFLFFNETNYQNDESNYFPVSKKENKKKLYDDLRPKKVIPALNI